MKKEYDFSKGTKNPYTKLLKKQFVINSSKVGVRDGSKCIVSIKKIKSVCRKLFKEKYPEIKCAYLFGSYARGSATSKSDVDILVVCPPMGMRFYGISELLEKELHKKVDLHTHRQLADNETFLAEILKDGIKIYSKK